MKCLPRSAIALAWIVAATSAHVGAGRARADLLSPVTVAGVAPGSGLPDGVIVSAGTRTSNVGSFGISINSGAGLSGNAAALAAFQRAANRWISRFDDPITVNINADLQTLGGGIIGQANSTLLQGTYNTIRNAIVADAAADSSPSDGIVAALPTAATFHAFVPSGSGWSLSGNIVLTQANAKALGLVNPTAGTDGQITFNSNFAFDFDNSDGVSPGTIDFETAAAHEIGHVLGFISAVDDVDFGIPFDISMNPLDLFRFQNNVAGRDPSNAAEFTTFARWLVPGGDAITDDIINEFRMSTGAQQGDGRQASHWRDDLLTGMTIGIMDPTLDFGVIEPNTAADFEALDLIGYNLVVPEPSTFLLLGIGLVGMAGYARKRRKATA